MSQLSLFDHVDPAPRSGRLRTCVQPKQRGRASIEARFELFHAENPHVLAEMLKLARHKVRAGYKRIGAKALWEELRNYIRVHALGNYKLDNSLTALYARKLIELEPALASVIETRRRKS